MRLEEENLSRFDVVIVGGGPAGMAAAMWAAELGLTAVLIEREGALGGQLSSIMNPIGNYPGVTAENGTVLRQMFTKHLEKAAFHRVLDASVLSIDNECPAVTLSNGSALSGRALVIATGVRRRSLGVPGESAFMGRGIMSSGVGDKDTVSGRSVVVIGGGDAAVENALILSEVAAKVVLIHRGPQLSAREGFVREMKTRENIELRFETTVVSFDGKDHLGSVRLVDRSGTISSLETDRALIRIGVVPNSEIAAGKLDTDPRGYIKVDGDCRSSAPSIFAIGDVAKPDSPTISTAIGTAAIALKYISLTSN